MLVSERHGAFLTQADHVAVGQWARCRQPYTIDEGTVGASQILDHHRLALAGDARVVSRDHLVFNHDVVAGMASQGHPFAIQHEDLTPERPPAHHQTLAARH